MVFRHTVTLESDVAVAPVQPDLVEGTVSVGSHRGMGTVTGMHLGFFTEVLGQAHISDFSGSYGIGAVTSELAVEFSPGAGAPGFDPVLVTASGTGPEAFIAPYGSGFPYAYGQGVAGPRTVPVAEADVRSGMSFDVAFTGLHSPTLDGVPHPAGMIVDEGHAAVEVTYEVDARVLTTGDDDRTGSRWGDVVDLGAGNDRFHSGRGHDVVKAGNGHDRVVGDRGHDILQGNRGHDRLWGEGGDDVLLGHGGRDLLHGKQNDDELHGGDHEDRLTGGRGDDLIYGGTGRDSLYGESGADRLDGGRGPDTMKGGWGPDVFIIDRREGHDTILDYNTASDHLRLPKAFRDDLEDGRIDGGDLVFDLDRGHSLTLEGVTDLEAVLDGVYWV